MRILGIDLEKLIIEAVDEINPMSREKHRQQLKSDELKPFKAKDKKKTDEEDEDADVDEAEDEDTAAETTSEPASVKENPEISAARIIKILNKMRSGKSLSNKEVRVQFQKYYNSLSGDERLALYSFLDSVYKIVAEDEEFDEKEIESPGDEGIDIETPDKAKEKAKKKTPPEKKGTASAPIVVGESADKTAILRKLKQNQ